MKKVKKRTTNFMPPVKMYWDELEEIYESMKKDRSATIESEGYEYDDLNELKSNTSKIFINKIKISARGKAFSNEISISITPSFVIIHQEESTETAARIKEILKKNSPWYMYSNFTLRACEQFLVGIMLGLALNLLVQYTNNTYLIIFGAVSLFLCLILIAKKENPILGKSKIFITYRKDKSNFFEKNKDEILMGLLFLFLGGIGTFIIQAL